MSVGQSHLTLVEQMARFASRASWDNISDAAREQLKIRVLDSLGCALGARSKGSRCAWSGRR